jgi:hypothetical protein
MKILLTAVVTGLSVATHQLYPATTASQFSNVGQYPIDVTLEIILTILANGILTVTLKVLL